MKVITKLRRYFIYQIKIIKKNRIEKKIPIKNILLSSIKRKFKESFSICREIAKEIEQEYKIIFPEDEIGYLAVHLENILIA